MRNIHLAIASTTSLPGDIGGNLKQIITFAHRAADDGVHLLLTPEMSASGYGNFPEVLATAEIAGAGPIYDSLSQAASATGVVICAGLVERDEASRYLVHAAIFPDGKYVFQRKHRITHSEQPLEPAVPQLPPFSADGTGQPGQVCLQLFEVHGVRCAMLICADSGITDISETMAAQGVQLSLVPVAGGGHCKDRVTTAELSTEAGRQKYLKILETVFFPGTGVTSCLQYRYGLAAVNLCGYDGQRHSHLGHGMIINPMGEVLGFFHGLPNLDRQRPMYAHAEIDVDDCLPE